jgi:hypothetical protein
MTRRRLAWTLALAGALYGSRAEAQLLGSKNRDSISEDEAVIELGVPPGSLLREAPPPSRSRRPPIYDDMIQRTQMQVDVQLDDSLPPTERGELNITPPGYERYSANSGLDRPTRVDYLFFGRSGVHSPVGGNVLMHEINVSHRLRMPIWDRASLRVQPFFNVLFLDGPHANDPDLPGRLFKLAADVELGLRLSETVLLSVAVTPGIWSDFEDIDGQDFRIPARALIAYKVNDSLYVSGGVIYTDNFYKNILPTFGVIWDYSDRIRLELVAPRARAVYRVHEELHFYVGFEGGGDTYTIRIAGDADKFQYRDLRGFVGAEIATWDRASILVETGYVFYRRFRLEDHESRNLDDAFFLRAGVRF